MRPMPSLSRNGAALLCLLGSLPFAAANQRVFVPLPQAMPILSQDATAIQPLPTRIAAAVAGLGAVQYRQRQAAREDLVKLLAREGTAAYDLLNATTYRHHPDPEIAVSVREVLVQVRPTVRAALDWAAIDRLLAGGQNPTTLERLNQGGQTVARQLLESHLRMETGVDILYSLNPENVLPDACNLLALQREDYYRTLLARVIAGVLERAVHPTPPAQTMNTRGIQFFAANPDLAQAMINLTTNRCDELRLTGLRICAYALLHLPEDRLLALSQDENSDIATEAARLGALLGKKGTGTDDHAQWIAGCLKALNQETDPLAQLGAYNALSCLIDLRADALYAAYTRADGRARDALCHLLSNSLIGRLLFLRDERSKEVRPIPSGSLAKILRLWNFDVKQQGLADLIATDREAVAPLVRRNLFVLGRSNKTWLNRVTASAPGWSAAVSLSMNDLAPVLEQQVAIQPNGSELDRVLRALKKTAGESFPAHPDKEWYALCAARLDAGPLDIRTGAVGSLLASGKAGAEALLARQRGTDWKDEEFGVYLKSLVLFHPYSKFLVNDTAAGRALQEDLKEGDLAYDSHVNGGSQGDNAIYDGGALRVPIALWAYVNNNDCNGMNPLGHYLAKTLKPVHAPLILSLLDHSSRMSIFLIETDAREAKEAVLRRVWQRRQDWGYCYDHDLFNYVVVFELLEALPFLEHYTKTNSNWPYQGIATISGEEKERYCWTPPVKSGRANPLALPSCRELLRQHGGKYMVRKYGDSILQDLKVPFLAEPKIGP